MSEQERAALLAAAEFIETTSGIGRSSNDYADGWYAAIGHAVSELRSRANSVSGLTEREAGR